MPAAPDTPRTATETTAARAESLAAAYDLADLDTFRRRNLAWHLMRIGQDFRTRAARAFARHGHAGMRTAHASVITYLPIEGCRLTELAARAGMTKQAMGELVGDMETLGYVARRPDPEDGRAKRIEFTPEGIELLDETRGILAGIWEAYAEIVGRPGLDALSDTLDRLIEGLDDRERRPDAP
ncbi:MAG: winged helix-turn-helix transcriptional regulator [Spirochaetaceae bacterium]|nr:winged helix-turn-helix transcriptional regulator [Myxococcales bacterium]MCB9725743.1 winged helix-turn-helix transcriptional regulator [Spirochaetaceae bacterium]